MENSKSETESMKIRNWKWLWYKKSCSDVNLRAPHCLVARTPLLSCAQWLFMYACTREDWPFTFILHRLNRSEITGICHGRGHILNYVMARRVVLTNQKPLSHLTHLISYYIYHNISCHIISYHIISHHHITSHHIISYHIISYHIHIISYHIIHIITISYHIISYHIIHIISYQFHIISYHIISYHIISYHIISYHIISYHIIPYFIIPHRTIIHIKNLH